MSNTIPTAEKLIKKVSIQCQTYIPGLMEDTMIEFAKLHVKAALEAASNNANMKLTGNYGLIPQNVENLHYDREVKQFFKQEYGHGDCGYEGVIVNKDSILAAYPEENIK